MAITRSRKQAGGGETGANRQQSSHGQGGAIERRRHDEGGIAQTRGESSSDSHLPPTSSSTNAPAPRPSKKRKRTQDEGKETKEKPEKRAKAFRKRPPHTYLERLERALTQRLCVLNRERTDHGPEPSEIFTLCGSTGNLYTVIIGKVPSCSCPDAGKGNQCKHIIYVLHNVLKVSEHLEYQRAFLTSELIDIFRNAPASPSESASLENEAGKRKPIEGDCPICFMPFEPEKSEIVWCKAACGNNVHKSCFQQWTATARAERKEVRCVYCRAIWAPDIGNVNDLLSNATISEDGYLNVAQAMGLSGERDYSTYHQPWAHRRYFRFS